MKKGWLITGIFFFFLIACKEKIEKKIELSYNDHSPKLIRYYKKNKGLSILIKETSFYPNKNILFEGEYNQNKRNGKWTSWYENGKKWSEMNYKNDVREGKNTTWYENGLKRYEGNYANDRKIGTWMFWDEKGKLINEINYNINF